MGRSAQVCSRPWLPVIAVAFLQVACGSSSGPTPSKESAKSAADAGGLAPKSAEPRPEFVGTLRGIVKLSTGAVLPLAPLPTEGKTDTAIAPGCPNISEADRKQVEESATTGGLSPLHVAITQMTAAPERAPVTHELEIRDCRLWPRMVAVRTGDQLRVINKSDAPFLPVLPRDAFMQALLPKTERTITVSGIGPMPIKCGFASYCGESVLVSTAHTLYAVTDAEGRFTITGVPLDQELKVHAWHPLFQPVSADLKLTSAERSKHLELAIQPLPASSDPEEPQPEPTQPAKKPATAKNKP